jgi:pimeloyl-ACP methyl ester carboxylesterase
MSIVFCRNWDMISTADPNVDLPAAQASQPKRCNMSSKKRGCLKWGGVAIGALALLLIVLLALTSLQGSRAKSALRAKYPPPGQMVDVGGYQMHICCQGSGSPTVILDAGLGDFSLTWHLVQPKVAQYTRACAYDRAGLGWSERGPKPRTMENIVEELHTLLTGDGIEGPYVLVGHSMGGVYVRAYAVQHPEEVVGMVLVDTAHEEQETRFPQSFTKANHRVQSQMAQFLTLPRLVNSLGLMAMSPEEYPEEFLPPMPEAIKDEYKGVILSDTRYFATVAEQYAKLDGNMAEVREMDITTLGDIPLVVLSTSEPEIPESFGLSVDEADQVRAVWDEMQGELAALSSRGERVFAEGSSHYIQFDQPELVINAIREVVEACRGE